MIPVARKGVAIGRLSGRGPLGGQFDRHAIQADAEICFAGHARRSQDANARIFRTSRGRRTYWTLAAAGASSSRCCSSSASTPVGIDTNAEAVERCRARGLDVAQADALEYVGALPDASLGGLFSAQVVEHLEAEYLMQLLDEVNRALRPGSRVVLETINPACWMAFFSAYVSDPTHRHPLHPDTLTYLLQASGFIDVDRLQYAGG